MSTPCLTSTLSRCLGPASWVRLQDIQLGRVIRRRQRQRRGQEGPSVGGRTVRGVSGTQLSEPGWPASLQKELMSSMKGTADCISLFYFRQSWWALEQVTS